MAVRLHDRGGCPLRNRLRGDQSGASAVEYAIMVTLIAVVVIVAVAFVGTSLNSDFECAASWVGSMPDDPGCTP